MPRYRYTGDHPVVAYGLTLGPGVGVETSDAATEGTPVVGPGDVLATTDPYVHPLFEPIEDDAPEATADEATETPAARRKTTKNTAEKE